MLPQDNAFSLMSLKSSWCILFGRRNVNYFFELFPIKSQHVPTPTIWMSYFFVSLVDIYGLNKVGQRYNISAIETNVEIVDY